MSLLEDVRLIRNTVSLDINRRKTILRIEGEEAWELLYSILPCDMFLSDSQIRHTVLLSEDGIVLADVYVCNDDEAFLLLIDGLHPQECLEYFGQHDDVSIVDLSTRYSLVSINGPFSWELLGKLDSLGAIGLPYMSFYMFRKDIICLRAGVTGEYSYTFIVPIHMEESFVDEVLQTGKEYGIRQVDRASIEYCRAENWFFDPHTEGKKGLNPYELQLSWRLRDQYDYRGADALQQDSKRRITAFRSSEKVHGAVLCEGTEIGVIVRCEKDIQKEDYFGIALLNRDFAHSGVHEYTVSSVKIQTHSPPFVINRSIFVKPQKHCFKERKSISIISSMEWEL